MGGLLKEAAAHHTKDCDSLPLDKLFWVSHFRETGQDGNIHLYDRHRLLNRTEIQGIKTRGDFFTLKKLRMTVPLFAEESKRQCSKTTNTTTHDRN